MRMVRKLRPITCLHLNKGRSHCLQQCVNKEVKATNRTEKVVIPVLQTFLHSETAH